MSAAAHVLHLAIEDAVQQLEPQLLPLFAGARGAREAVVRPKLRTQLALKMLVALTRFFPEEHRVRQAGRQLELIWPPLVHEPRGAAAGKLLHYYFRLRQDLLDSPEQALRAAMREHVRSTIDAAQASGAVEEDCDRRLHQLASFLPEGWVERARLAQLSPLARLCAWQQALEAHQGEKPEHDAASMVLLADMLILLDRCTSLCRASHWTLDYFCNSGLARCLWQLRGMARFCRNMPMVELFEELDDECLDMHLAGNAPPAATLQQWLVRLFAVVHRHHIVRPPSPDMATAPELPFRAVYDQELSSYRRQLQAELHAQLQLREIAGTGDGSGNNQSLRVTAPLITLLYKLTWVFAAAEQHDWSRLCHCAYRVALQHWRVRRPLGAEVEALLLDLALKPGTLLASSVLRQWRWNLLRDWPNWADDTKRPIALDAGAQTVVALEAVPDLLSASFTTLVQAGRLAATPSAQACEPYYQVLVQDLSSELLQELALLEKGAAAMRVWPLEQLCTLLIGVYELRLREQPALPAALLQDAHRQLVRMLDQAAAWREVKCDDSLVRELEAWLRRNSEPALACREPRSGDSTGPETVGSEASGGAGSASEALLRTHLLSCLGTLASVLERPVRLQLDAAGVQLDAQRMTQVLDCLRPLLKFMLLDQLVDTRTRHAMHKPRVSTVAVSLRAMSSTLVITVGEDSHETLLTQPELQRLQRRLPKTAGPLACESRAGHGRCFTFTLG